MSTTVGRKNKTLLYLIASTPLMAKLDFSTGVVTELSFGGLVLYCGTSCAQ